MEEILKVSFICDGLCICDLVCVYFYFSILLSSCVKVVAAATTSVVKFAENDTQDEQLRFHVVGGLNLPKTRQAGSCGVWLELELYVNEVASNLFAMEQQNVTEGAVAANATICPVRPTPGNSYFKGQVIV